MFFCAWAAGVGLTKVGAERGSGLHRRSCDVIDGRGWRMT